MSAKPTWINGAIVGFWVAIALVALFYLAFSLVGTPFVPFDAFDWVGRNLPGAVITTGIDSIVAVIRGLNIGDTSRAAKTAEHVLAIIGMVVTVTGLGAVIFVQTSRQSQNHWGVQLSGLLGAVLALISFTVNRTSPNPALLNIVWIIAAFAAAGWLIDWAYSRLRTPATDSVAQADRRKFLITFGGATAAFTLLGSGLALALTRKEDTTVALVSGEAKTWSEGNPLPNADDALIPAPGTRPELTPLTDHYRIDINTFPPNVNEADWALEIDGLVNKPQKVTLKQLRDDFTPINQFVTLACISNPIGGDLIGTTRWTGARLKDVLALADLKPEATHIRITAADGFDEITALDLVNGDDRVMLAYAWDGLPLTVAHGFPIRIYLPNHYGMKQPKWISKIEAIPAWEEGYWVRRGWDREALMQTTAVIDTVAVDMPQGEGDAKLIPIGGIAHAGDRGISKVEVQIDGGEWVEAQLRKPLSQTTWVIWRYDWPFQAGDHTVAVRATNGDGLLQTSAQTGVRPSGATGYFSRQVSV